jgi:predicted Zn-ribbon and HTH transcriptional regulator
LASPYGGLTPENILVQFPSRISWENKERDQVQTIRQQIIELLREREMSARELSQTMRIGEKEVYEHLPHIARSLAAQRKKLVVLPFQCLVCGYVFEERRRFTRPGRCPCCKKAHLAWPMYKIQ